MAAWSRATPVIRCRAPIPISNRCGQTSTEVEVDHPVVSRGLDICPRTWVQAPWSRGPGGSNRVLVIRVLTWGLTEWELRGLACRQLQDPGL